MTINSLKPSSIKNFFGKLVNMSFLDLGNDKDSSAAGYISEMLTEFARTEKLYKISDSEGRRVESIVEIILESQNKNNNNSESERELRKYVGDFSLFMSGVFRDYLIRGSYLNYYIDQGTKSYFLVSRLDLEMGKGDPIFFNKLSQEFEFYSGALDYMRKVYFKHGLSEHMFANFANELSKLKH